MHVNFVDQTLRDGQQSLWGLRMRAFEAAGALPHLAKAGYHTIDLTGPGMFTVLTRDYFDDPWDTTDFLVKGLPGNILRAGMRTFSVMGFALAPNSIIDLWVKTLIKHGVTSFWLYDVAYDMPLMKRLVDVVHAEGGEAVPTVMYGLTSVHGDDFFADRAREMASWDGVKKIEVEDAPGILTPERARTLLPAIREAVPDVELELHCHDNTGLAIHNYVEGLKAGFNTFHTASRPMANGVSLPSTEAFVNVVEHMGHTHSLDKSTFAPVEEHFLEAARRGNHLVGEPAEYDPRIYDHQLPGGMTGTLLRQLGQHGMEHRFDDVLAEIPRVRKDFGEPIMATPMSQFVGIQAVLNIVTGDPYSISPDEVVHYLLGHYGPIYGPVNQNMKDRILSNPRAQEIERTWERPNQSLKEIRDIFGHDISDEELLLRFMNHKDEVDKTLANGPVRKDPRWSTNSIVNNIVDLIPESQPGTRVVIETPQVSLELAQNSGK